MFGPLGFQEVLFIVVLALLIFGPKRLPEIGRTIGKGMAQFRKASNDLKRSIETEIALEERPQAPRRPNVFYPPGADSAVASPPAVVTSPPLAAGHPASTEILLPAEPTAALPTAVDADAPAEPSRSS